MPAIAIPRPAEMPPPYYTRCMRCGALAARRCKHGDCRHCDKCEAAFIPCHDACPGYMINMDCDDDANPIEVCDECRVAAKGKLEDADARRWPEAYLAVASAWRDFERDLKREIDREGDE